MKKILVAMLMVFVLGLSGCIFKESNDAEYSGNFKNDPVYQEIMAIESCTDHKQLISMLEDIYDEEITYVELEFDEKSNGFKKPYEDFQINVFSVYSTKKNKGRISSDVYAFFIEFQESPVFVMDKDGSYLVGNYEVETIKEDNYLHKVNAWATSDLFLSLNKYTNKSCQEEYAAMVKTMDYYVDFENMLRKNMETDANSLEKS